MYCTPIFHRNSFRPLAFYQDLYSSFTVPIFIPSSTMTLSFLLTLLLCVLASSQIAGFQQKSVCNSATSLSLPPKQTSMCLMFSNKSNDDGAEISTDADAAEVVVTRQTNNPLRLAVLRLGFTEPAWTSPLNYGEKNGKFTCAYCGNDLFDSAAKYDSGSGWPSFWRSIDEGAISYKMEFDGRLECKCGKCDSHLGHVFLDGPKQSEVAEDILEASPSSDPRGRNPNGRLPRFCVNGACLNLEKVN